MEARRLKAHELADRAHITFKDGCYHVPSQSGNGVYTVILGERDSLCECPDFELRGEAGKPCKHIMAARLWRDRQARGVEQDRSNTEPSPKLPRPTYAQDWPNYNAAQTNERRHFMDLLADLCRTIPEPPRKPGPSRKPIPLADAVYSAVFKVYSTLAARRFNGDLEESHERGLIGCLPHFNSVLNCLDNPAVTPILLDLIQRSSLPLRAIETTFAPDSSGFCTSRFIRWFDVKYGVTREKAEWVKAHVMVSTKTNVITAAVIAEKDAGDSPQFPALLKATAQGFKVVEVDADKAYTAAEHFKAVDALGGTLFAPFKTNATGAAGGKFEEMFHYFCFRREEFLRHYHQRSNVESTFSMVKRKFGDSVRSKTATAQKNEVLAKFVAHNVCCLISAWFELGIEPVFAASQQGAEPRTVIPMPRRG